MRRTASEKMEIIRLVEGTDLPVRVTLRQLGVPRSTFYGWYQRYIDQGFEGLHDKKPAPRPRWNAIPEAVQRQVLEMALERTDRPGDPSEPIPDPRHLVAPFDIRAHWGKNTPEIRQQSTGKTRHVLLRQSPWPGVLHSVEANFIERMCQSDTLFSRQDFDFIQVLHEIRHFIRAIDPSEAGEDPVPGFTQQQHRLHLDRCWRSVPTIRHTIFGL